MFGEDLSMSRQLATDTIIATSRQLAAMDPLDEAVGRTVAELEANAKLLKEQASEDKSSPWGAQSMKDDIEAIGAQITTLKAAAALPASNYRRMYEILAGLEKAWTIASRPQNAALRPKLATVFKKTAGIFAEVDTVQDLDKPLEAIEKAVHSLYSGGKMNDPATYNFAQRGKGHQGKGE